MVFGRALPKQVWFPLIQLILKIWPQHRLKCVNAIEHLTTLSPDRKAYLREFQKHQSSAQELNLNQYLAKMHDFENAHREDIFVPREQFQTLIASFKRLDRVQSLVGHGNFNVVSFDDVLRYGRNYSAVGVFEAAEVNFIASVFDADALGYGFFGNRVVDKLTSVVSSERSCESR